MNTISKLTIAGLLSLGLFITQSCVQDDDYSVPPVECPKVDANISIKDLKEKLKTGQLNVDQKGNILDDLILEGFVVSNDETGNIYKTLMLQNSATDGTDGIQFVSDLINLYTKYPLGSKIQIHLKGLKVFEDRGAIKIGSSVGQYDLNNLLENDIKSKIFRTCDPVTEIKPRVFTNIKDILKEENINTVVTLEGVQFLQPEIDKTYAEDKITKDRDLQDKKGDVVILRNSGYAKWWQTSLPTGSGSIRVIVSRYNSTWQLYINDTNDVKFDQARFDTGGGENPGGGNNTEATNLLFKGSDFNNWTDFISSINTNFGLKDYATSAVGLGRDNTNALQIKGTPGANDYVFTGLLTDALPANPKKITFYVKGKSGKSLSLNLNKSTTGFTAFNVGNLSNEAVTISAAANNQYNGAIDTKGEWVLVTLNIEGLDIQKTSRGDLFSLKVGRDEAYDLIIDNIKID